jgi:hypothetical protein
MATATTTRLAPRRPASQTSSAPAAKVPWRPIVERWVLPLGVLLVAGYFGHGLWLRYLPDHRLLWNNLIHDRHAHLHSGLSTALDMQHGRWLGVLSDIDKCRTWPPLHDSLLLGATLLAADGDVRYAVWPSLIAWMGTAFFAFLTARRLCGAGGNVAGLVAALFVLVSPAHRAYATDVMLESPGAFFTLACLYFCVACRQTPTAWACRGFGLALTALFFTKYNYWLLVVLCIGAEQLATSPRMYVAWLLGAWGFVRQGGWLRRQCLSPLNIVAGGLILVIAINHALGVTHWSIFGTTISVRSPANMLTAAYLLLLIRVASWYWREGFEIARKYLGAAGMAVLRWHVWPLAVWFLWPQRIYSLLWVSNPASNAGERPQFDAWGGYPFYWNCFTDDYMVGAGIALAAMALAGATLAVCMAGRLRQGTTVVLAVAIIGLLLTAHHPNRKSRFLHSWIAVTWVVAGVGAGWLARSRPGALGLLTRGGAGVALGALALWQLPSLTAAPHAPEGGIPPGGPDALLITDSYLPMLHSGRHAVVLSNMPIKWLVRWTFLSRFDHDAVLETDIPFFEGSGTQSQARFAAWFASTKADTFVHVDIARTSPLFAPVPGLENYYHLGEWLAEQETLVMDRRIILAEQGCVLTVWRRRG